ncbi:hypothetical protein H4R24_000932 [Coemansia sp. RSA 988]|nr:hypothetical protein H4R24_000932 [Coemansia sp. RSA 988]
MTRRRRAIVLVECARYVLDAAPHCALPFRLLSKQSPADVPVQSALDAFPRPAPAGCQPHPRTRESACPPDTQQQQPALQGPTCIASSRRTPQADKIRAATASPEASPLSQSADVLSLNMPPSPLAAVPNLCADDGIRRSLQLYIMVFFAMAHAIPVLRTGTDILWQGTGAQPPPRLSRRHFHSLLEPDSLQEEAEQELHQHLTKAH